MDQGCRSDIRTRTVAPAHEAKEENMMNEKVRKMSMRGGVRTFRGKYVREVVSGRKGAVEFGTRVCMGAGRFVMIVFRQALNRYDLVEIS